MKRVHIPIFPLPDLTFFPHTVLPLHVFEPRYRALVADCLSRRRRLAVVGIKPGYEEAHAGKPPVERTAGAGLIVRWERLASGRYNILLKGECRIRIEGELPTDTLYRIARGMVLDESGADRPAVPDLVTEVKERCRQIVRAIGRSTEALEEALRGPMPPGALCDRVASAVLPMARVRQELLDETDVERRLARLSSALGDLLKQATGER